MHLYIFIIPTQNRKLVKLDMIGSQFNLIEQYNKQLEQQNLIKNQEIEKLKKQMDLITLSSRLQALNNESKCKQCSRKQQQIQTLIKALKTFRNLSHNKSTQIKEEIIQVTQFQSKSDRNSDLQKSFAIRPSQAELNANVNQKQISYQLLKSNPNHELLSASSNNRIQTQSLKKSNQNLKCQLENLRQRLNLFQKKMLILQETNKILRQQIVRSKASLPKLSQDNEYGFSFQANSSVKVDRQRNSIINQEIKRHIPAFTSVRQSAMRASVQMQPAQITISPVLTPVNKITKIRTVIPTALYGHPERIQADERWSINTKFRSERKDPKSNRTAKASKQTRHNQYNSSFSSRLVTEQNSGHQTYRTLNEDLLEERRKSLNHKIKILENQNRKLRSQIAIN